MPLPIRDGNQSLTTLSTILVSNAHIPAHTVVSLGTQAITDIATAVSGVELGPNTLNALENITVTLGQVTITGGLTDAQLRASAVTVGGGVYLADAQSVIGSSIPPEVIQIGGKNLADSKLYPIAVDSNGVQSISGVVTANLGSAIPAGTAQIGSVTASIIGTATITGSTSILNFPATQTVTFTEASVTFGQSTITGSVSVLNFPASQSVTFTTATVTFGTAVVTGSTSVLNFPATQTVTFTQIATHGVIIENTSVTVNGAFYQATQPVSLATLPALVAGTAQIGNVTASNLTSALAVYSGGNSDISVNIKSVGGQSFGQGQTWVPVSITEGSLPAGTNRIGVVTIGAGTVTIGAGTSQIGSVTVGNSVTIGYLPAISGTVEIAPNQSFNGIVVEADSGFGSDPRYMVVAGGFENTSQEFRALTFGAGGTLLVSGTVTANTFAVQGTAVTTSNFTSTTPSTVLAGFNASREVLTIFNEGAGNLHICAGATCTTIAYQVRLSAGDYYEVPNHQTTITHSAVFATAGTARVTEIS